jgi:hypothetical protein
MTTNSGILPDVYSSIFFINFQLSCPSHASIFWRRHVPQYPHMKKRTAILSSLKLGKNHYFFTKLTFSPAIAISASAWIYQLSHVKYYIVLQYSLYLQIKNMTLRPMRRCWAFPVPNLRSSRTSRPRSGYALKREQKQILDKKWVTFPGIATLRFPLPLTSPLPLHTELHTFTILHGVTLSQPLGSKGQNPADR